MPLEKIELLQRLAWMAVAVLLCACNGTAESAAQPDVVGRWTLVAAENDVETVRVPPGTAAELELTADSVFRFRYGAQDSAEGTYRLTVENHERLGRRPVIRLSHDPEYFAGDSAFVLSVTADTMILVSLWTDSWNHRFVRAQSANR